MSRSIYAPEPPPAGPALARACARLAASAVFQRAVLALIVFAAVLTGLETYPAVIDRFGPLLIWLDRAVIALFTLEIAIRLLAYGRRPWRFFLDGWNLFDFLIVAACLAPVGMQHAAAARLVRLLRVFRLFSGVPRLRIIVSAMLKALPSIGYVSLLLAMLFYVYGVMGVTLFAANDPVHFGDLHTALLSLLRTVTLEDWTDLMYIQIYGSDIYGYGEAAAKLSASQAEMWAPRAMPIAGVLYFVSFVVIGTLIVLNLFVGVVISSLSEAQAEQLDDALAARGREAGADLAGQLDGLEVQLDAVRQRVREIRGTLRAD